mmetsp:Transcript_29915/g.58692  ORF Transcript_29915/g.58692 Transcript_29915/m.58692 type:complete len:117 (+) Transcript_29915:93-443(+)
MTLQPGTLLKGSSARFVFYGFGRSKESRAERGGVSREVPPASFFASSEIKKRRQGGSRDEKERKGSGRKEVNAQKPLAFVHGFSIFLKHLSLPPYLSTRMCLVCLRRSPSLSVRAH